MKTFGFVELNDGSRAEEKKAGLPPFGSAEDKRLPRLVRQGTVAEPVEEDP